MNPPHKIGQFGLNQHELRVLKEILKASADKQIAFDLGLAQSTIKSYIASLYRKTGANKAGSPRVFIVNLWHTRPELFL